MSLSFLNLDLLFIFGTLIGSFLNVVILRFNTGKPIVSLRFGGKVSRSECFSCGKTLKWWELVPIFSFLVLRGKCSTCHAKISWQYPIVEIVTGALLVLIYLKFGAIWPIIFYFLVWCVLLVITVYDLKHKIIPDFFVYTFIFLSLAFNIFGVFSASALSMLDFWAGPMFFAAFAGLWLLSRGRWLGFGDAKLVLGIGFLLGWLGGLSALVLAFWIGAIFGLGLIAWGKLAEKLAEKNVIPLARLPRALTRLTMKSEIPFAPFLILGTAIAFFCNVIVFAI